MWKGGLFRQDWLILLMRGIFSISSVKKLSNLAFWLTLLTLDIFFLCKTTDMFFLKKSHHLSAYCRWWSWVIFLVLMLMKLYVYLVCNKTLCDSFYTAISILLFRMQNHTLSCCCCFATHHQCPQQYNSKHTSINNIII